MKAKVSKYQLKFKRQSGTSRGVLHEKDTYFITLEEDGKKGVGECNLFAGLSFDDVPHYEGILYQLCQSLEEGKPFDWEEYREYPSLQFGVEQALKQLNTNRDVLFESDFTDGKKGILINGLIWMGDIDYMKSQIKEKLNAGFTCIKIKIGVHWEVERFVLEELRKEFGPRDLEIRVDANGAFDFATAKKVLRTLYSLKIHSIEQPIKQGNLDQMAQLCETTPVPIALDEELIGVIQYDDKAKLLAAINPQYIILKPALIGGFKGSKEWIKLAKSKNINWWITSALESNVGLNALAQWTYILGNPMPQGLGTGSLYHNNIQSKLEVRGQKLWYNP